MICEQLVVVRAAVRARDPSSRYSIERLERERADRRLLLVGQPALRHAEEQRVGAQVVAEQRQVTGEVGERRQQRRHLGLGDR